MSSDKSPKNHEAALEAVETAKATRNAANESMQEFLKENKLKKGDHSEHEDKKVAKEYKRIAASQKEARAAFALAEEAAKALKPAKTRVTTYEYPKEITTPEDKKRYRAKMRTAAKQKDKPEGEAKPKKKKTEEAAPEVTSKKSSKEGKEGKKKKKKSTSSED